MTFEQYLQDMHSKRYTGTDDNMPDAFDTWLTELDTETIIAFAELWHRQQINKHEQKDN